MKRFLSFLFVLVLFLGGCSNDEVGLNPETQTSFQFLTIPENSSVLAKKYYFSESIDGAIGGQVDFHLSYKVGESEFKVYGNLIIPAAAYQGVKDITLILDNEYAGINLYPSPITFDIPLELTLYYEGLDLTRITPEQLNFYYVDEDGSLKELIESSVKIFEQSSGTLGIINGTIPHFSRFVWVK